MRERERKKDKKHMTEIKRDNEREITNHKKKTEIERER